jgi:ADP-ribose diphosphatase
MSKVPDQAKRVFKGEIFDVYQWPQQMYDDSTETFEMLKRSDTVVMVAVSENGRIVLVDEEQPTQKRERSLPTGRVEAGEEPLVAAMRELAEETGYTSEQWELWRSYQPHSKIEWTVWYFVARGARKTTTQKLDAGEKIEVHDVSIPEFLNMLSRGEPALNQFTADIMREIIAGKRAELERFLHNAQSSSQN